MASRHPDLPVARTPPFYADGGEITTPEALELAELELIYLDLATVIANFALLEKRYTKTDLLGTDDRTICEALYRDAVVMLIGCYASKEMGPFKADISEVLPEANELLGRLQEIRDTFVAHRFGPYRQCYIVALPEASPGEIGFVPCTMVHALPLPEDVPKYLRLARVARDIVGLTVVMRRQAILERVKYMGLEGIKALPPFLMTWPDFKHLRMSRKAFRALRDGLPTQTRGGPKDRKSKP